MKLEGKVAIVTGGARDLGRAISVKLAAEGAKVCLNYFDNEADAQETLALKTWVVKQSLFRVI